MLESRELISRYMNGNRIQGYCLEIHGLADDVNALTEKLQSKCNL